MAEMVVDMEGTLARLRSDREAQAKVVQAEQGKLAQLDNAIRAMSSAVRVNGVSAESAEFQQLGMTEAAQVLLGEKDGQTSRELGDQMIKRGLIYTGKTKFTSAIHTTLAHGLAENTGNPKFTRRDGKWFRYKGKK